MVASQILNPWQAFLQPLRLLLCQICLVKQAHAMFVCKCAGQPKVLDHLSNVVSIEWAGSDALVYTQADALGRPSKVLCVYACTAFKPAPMRHTSSYICKEGTTSSYVRMLLQISSTL